MGPELLRNEAVKVGILSEILTLVWFHFNRFQSGKNRLEFRWGKTKKGNNEGNYSGAKIFVYHPCRDSPRKCFPFFSEEVKQNVLAGHYSSARVVAFSPRKGGDKKK